MSLLWNHLLFGKAGGGIFVLGFNLSQGVLMRKEGSRCTHPIGQLGPIVLRLLIIWQMSQSLWGQTLNRCADLEIMRWADCSWYLQVWSNDFKKKSLRPSSLFVPSLILLCTLAHVCTPQPAGPNAGHSTPKSHPLNLLPDDRCTHLPCSRGRRLHLAWLGQGIFGSQVPGAWSGREIGAVWKAMPGKRRWSYLLAQNW